MYNDLDKKFDIATKKALPYLVLSPPKFRTEVAELMEVLFHQLLQRSDSDFDIHYAQLNDLIDNRNSFESNLENRVWRFANMFVPMEKTIYQMSKQLTKLEKRVGISERETNALKKSVKILTKNNEKRILDIEPVKEGIKETMSHIEPVKETMSHIDTSADTLIKKSGEFFCGICKNKLRLWKDGNQTLYHRYRCFRCKVIFKTDISGNVLPVKRTKGKLLHIERLIAEQEANKP